MRRECGCCNMHRGDRASCAQSEVASRGISPGSDARRKRLRTGKVPAKVFSIPSPWAVRCQRWYARLTRSHRNGTKSQRTFECRNMTQSEISGTTARIACAETPSRRIGRSWNARVTRSLSGCTRDDEIQFISSGEWWIACAPRRALVEETMRPVVDKVRDEAHIDALEPRRLTRDWSKAVLQEVPWNVPNAHHERAGEDQRGQHRAGDATREERRREPVNDVQP